MARRNRTKKTSGETRENMTEGINPETQAPAVAEGSASSNPDQPQAMAALALSGPSSPEQPQ